MVDQPGKEYSLFLSSDFDKSQWVEQIRNLQNQSPQTENISKPDIISSVECSQDIVKRSRIAFLTDDKLRKSFWNGDFFLVIKSLSGLSNSSNIYLVIEVDSYGHFLQKVQSRIIEGCNNPTWDDAFLIEFECSKYMRIIVYEITKTGEKLLRGKTSLRLSRSWLGDSYTKHKLSIQEMKITFEAKFVAGEEKIRRVPALTVNSLFKTSISETTMRERRAVPFIITSLVEEVERRGITEVGIYRVNGSASEMGKLKKVYGGNHYEAEQIIKECDIHSVGGILKQYLRDLPECIFTTEIFNNLNEANTIDDEEERSRSLLRIFSQMPQNPNQVCVIFLLEHLARVSKMEQQNKMSVENLSTVFGPTMLYPGKEDDILPTTTVDLMGQSKILYFFLSRCARGEVIKIR